MDGTSRDHCKIVDIEISTEKEQYTLGFLDVAREPLSASADSTMKIVEKKWEDENLAWPVNQNFHPGILRKSQLCKEQ